MYNTKSRTPTLLHFYSSTIISISKVAQSADDPAALCLQ